MTTFDRGCFEADGIVARFNPGTKPLAPHVAYVEVERGRRGLERREVTWAEVMEARRERQAERLKWIRLPEVPEVRPCVLWVFDNGEGLGGVAFAGWYACALVRGRDGKVEAESLGVGKRCVGGAAAERLMREVPVGVLPQAAFWEAWCVEFARRHPKRRTRKDPRRAGVLLGWWWRDNFYRQKPTTTEMP